MKKRGKLHIGLRTVKTTLAVLLSMVIVDSLGSTAGTKLIFAMLGAMTAVQPTFKGSVESSFAQIVGVFLGAMAGLLLCALPIPSLLAAGIGIVLIITLYNAFRVRFTAVLPCFIVVMLCVTPDLDPLVYAVGRIWDTTIGIGVGMLVNMLVFPYDNSRQIRSTIKQLDRELIQFLEELFDGDDVIPRTERMDQKIQDMEQQLSIFSDQRFPLRRYHQRDQLKTFRLCDEKARELVAQMEVLRYMGIPGRLSDDNQQRLKNAGARILVKDQGDIQDWTERDVVTNYHVSQILTIRLELLAALRRNDSIDTGDHRWNNIHNGSASGEMQ